MKSSRKAVLTAIVSDLAIATAKLTAWAFTHSSGTLSKAIHSLVDAGNGSLLVVGLHRSRKQADETHPFGYGKELYSTSGQRRHIARDPSAHAGRAGC